MEITSGIFTIPLKPKVKEKVDHVLQIVISVERIPSNFFKHLEDGIYEIRIIMKPEKTKEGNKVNPKTINALFDQKYGSKGTPSRKEFEQKAEAYMIAELIKELRKKAQLTQAQLADRLNVKRTYISKIERASSDIRISTLRKIVETGLGGKLHIHVEL